MGLASFGKKKIMSCAYICKSGWQNTFQTRNPWSVESVQYIEFRFFKLRESGLLAFLPVVAKNDK